MTTLMPSSLIQDSLGSHMLAKLEPRANEQMDLDSAQRAVAKELREGPGTSTPPRPGACK